MICRSILTFWILASCLGQATDTRLGERAPIDIHIKSIKANVASYRSERDDDSPLIDIDEFAMATKNDLGRFDGYATTITFSIFNNSSSAKRVSTNSLIAAMLDIQLKVGTTVYKYIGPNHITPTSGKAEFCHLVLAKDRLDIPITLKGLMVPIDVEVHQDPMPYHEEQLDRCSATVSIDVSITEAAYDYAPSFKTEVNDPDIELRWYSRRAYPERREVLGR